MQRLNSSKKVPFWRGSVVNPAFAWREKVSRQRRYV